MIRGLLWIAIVVHCNSRRASAMHDPNAWIIESQTMIDQADAQGALLNTGRRESRFAARSRVAVTTWLRNVVP